MVFLLPPSPPAGVPRAADDAKGAARDNRAERMAEMFNGGTEPEGLTLSTVLGSYGIVSGACVIVREERKAVATCDARHPWPRGPHLSPRGAAGRSAE